MKNGLRSLFPIRLSDVKPLNWVIIRNTEHIHQNKNKNSKYNFFQKRSIQYHYLKKKLKIII